MLKRLYRWFFGYLFLVLKGNYIERFLNLCNSKDIKIWGMEHKDGRYHCFMMLSDYKSIRSIAKKSRVVPYIKERHGFPFILKKAWNRKGFFFGIITFCIVVFLLSLHIWDIKIEGGYKHTEEEMISYLKTLDVYSGMKIKEVDCPLIEEDIRKEYTDIGWVSAEILGTQLIIRIEETTVPALTEDTLKTDLPYAHLVAAKDAIVVSIVTRSGTPKVDIGSIVKEGDILISGIIPVIGDNDILLNNKLVIADGTIICRTNYDYKDQFSLKYKYPHYTGEVKKGHELYLFGKKIFSYSPSNSYKHCDIITEVNTLKLLRNFYLPFSVSTSTVSEYEVMEATYSEAEALEIANRKLLRYMEDLKKNGATIIENKVEVTIKNGKCLAAGKIIVEEPAWKYNEINDDEWRIIETDEHNGDNH